MSPKFQERPDLVDSFLFTKEGLSAAASSAGKDKFLKNGRFLFLFFQGSLVRETA
jgi:hypothetical protein